MMASTQRRIDRVFPKIVIVDYVSRVIARDRETQWTRSSGLSTGPVGGEAPITIEAATYARGIPVVKRQIFREWLDRESE
jgi:hypothetical protein